MVKINMGVVCVVMGKELRDVRGFCRKVLLGKGVDGGLGVV